MLAWNSDVYVQPGISVPSSLCVMWRCNCSHSSVYSNLGKETIQGGNNTKTSREQWDVIYLCFTFLMISSYLTCHCLILRYKSTNLSSSRGTLVQCFLCTSFSHHWHVAEVLFNGYASDNGMFLPMTIPKLSAETLQSWSRLSYVDMVKQVCQLYVEDEIPSIDINGIVLYLINFNHQTLTSKSVFIVRRL